jgi:Natural resistance-associated macrophage protein
MRVHVRGPKRRKNEQQAFCNPQDCSLDVCLDAVGECEIPIGARLDRSSGKTGRTFHILRCHFDGAALVRVEEPQHEDVPVPAKGIVVRRSWQKHVLTFLMVFGPGLIVMEADNDAGAVSTYMQAGGQYGLHLLWLLVVLLPICYFVQEMVARLGIATGKGHAAMIYERFGKWWGPSLSSICSPLTS